MAGGKKICLQEQLNKTAKRLDNVEKSLSEVESALSEVEDDGSLKSKKVKWLVKSNTVVKLLEEAQLAKGDLSFIIQWQQSHQIEFSCMQHCHRHHERESCVLFFDRRLEGRISDRLVTSGRLLA